jgi:mono/diheme cytochrome c family protein
VSGLPGGPGAELTAQACQGCHGLDTVTSERHDLAGWKGVVQDMVNNGASLTDTQADQVAAYLATNFGPTPPAGR